MFKHQLPRQNSLHEVQKIAYSPVNVLKHISLGAPFICSGMLDNWPALRRWNPAYLSAKCAGNKVIVKDIKRNKKDICQFGEAMRVLQRQNQGEIENDVVIQMSQIKTGRYFSRSKPALEVLYDDIVLPKIIPHRRIVEINFWAGSGGNVTELHFDPLDNFLSVVRGEKNVIIFPRYETKNLYNASPEISKKTISHSLVDIQDIDVTQYPKILSAKYYECSLMEGETLYIPSGYWHVVQSVHFNLAVNFWWLPKFRDIFKLPASRFWRSEIVSRVLGKGTSVPHSIQQKIQE